MDDRSQFCTFFINGQLYGVPVEEVQEVLSVLHITPVPLSPAPVKGLLNIRGRIVTAMDMRRVMGLPAAKDQDNMMNVVVRDDGAEVSLVVDSIYDILTLREKQMQPPPETVPEEAKPYISGVFPLEKDLMLVLDVRRVLDDDQCIKTAIPTSERQRTEHTIH